MAEKSDSESEGDEWSDEDGAKPATPQEEEEEWSDDE
jgi:hypothetical protein